MYEYCIELWWRYKLFFFVLREGTICHGLNCSLSKSIKIPSLYWILYKLLLFFTLWYILAWFFFSFENTFYSNFKIWNRLLGIFGWYNLKHNKINRKCVVINIKGLCWPLYKPHIYCKAISRIVWAVNYDHDIINTPN